MFRKLAGSLAGGAAAVFTRHPLELSRAVEEAWSLSPTAPAGSQLPIGIGGVASGLNAVYRLPWRPDHLIYAYMIENTRIIEIFRRVLWEYAHGERLEVPSPGGLLWLRSTEDLFYREPPPFHVASLTSTIRPDARAARRNAYYRFFGMDLNHGTDDNAPYPYAKAAGSNRDFVTTFEEFLREVWRGIENEQNQSGVNPTDRAALAHLARRMSEMLRVRRQSPTLHNLAREEFWYVATLSWFHLAVEFDSPVVVDLKAQAESPNDRLMKVGERVGLPPHAKSDAYFLLADAMSTLLIEIESSAYNQPAATQALYSPGTVRSMMETIITQWSIATGRDMKAGQVTLSPRREVSPMVATNGARPVAGGVR